MTIPMLDSFSTNRYSLCHDDSEAMDTAIMTETELSRHGLTQKAVLHACKPNLWEFGNQVLYDLCREYPAHERP
ncbi:MAG: hypothetical protein U1E27_06245, partial [Kiritimatiellia bacterium]|nr:hypothetical protein [Kiritimatiellia bacterium]